MRRRVNRTIGGVRRLSRLVAVAGLAVVMIAVAVTTSGASVDAQGDDLPFEEATGIDARCRGEGGCTPADIMSGFSTHARFVFPDGGFDGYGYDVTVVNESPQGHFVSGQFSLTQGDGGYAGIQTDLSGPVGKAALFSIFTSAVGARAAGDDGQVVEDCEEMMPGGPCIGFWSVRRPFEWQQGVTYRIEVRRAEDEGDDRWFDAFVISSDGSEFDIGGIKVPQAAGLLDPVAFWVEHFATQISDVGCEGPDLFQADITNVEVTLGGVITEPTAAVWTTDLVTACPGLQQTSGLADGVRHQTGGLGDPPPPTPSPTPTVATPTPTPTPVGPPPPLPLGDVNCSGDLNIVDALGIARYVVGQVEGVETCNLGPEQINITLADIDGNGRVNIVDALIVVVCAVGLDSPFCPAGAEPR